MSKEEIRKIIENNKNPKGVIAEGKNGDLYFLTTAKAESSRLRLSDEQRKVRDSVVQKMASHSRKASGGVTPMARDFCDDVMDDLSSHKPNYGEWYTMAKWFLTNC